jgi:tRNA A-37 threonylcarbamoyl transferase component Bud32
MQTRLVADRYQLIRELGRGGMGTVWLGEDSLVGRQVAVKEIRPPQGLSDTDRETFGRRALQEARSAARVHHPNAVTLFDIIPADAHDEAVYLIMEYIEGTTLAQVITRDGTVPEQQTAALGLQVLAVLETAHALGIVHRDIKPGNIMITGSGQAKLADFGIAHTLGETRLTRSGVMGTHAYMAPELFESQPITPAVDLWSLGATLYHAVQGHGPFDRDTTGATLRAILMEDLPVPQCSAPLATAITGMLHRDPAQRAAISQARSLLQTATTQTAEQTGTSPAGDTGAFGAATGQAATGAAAGPGASAGYSAADWEQAATRRRPSPDADAPRATTAPPTAAAGTIRFSNTSRSLHALIVAIMVALGVGFGALLVAGTGGAPVLLVWEIIYFVIVGLLYQKFGPRRWWSLTVDAHGLITWRGASDKNRQAIRWEQVTKISPMPEGAKTYLFAWRDGPDATTPVQLCPLDPTRFSPAAIRDAILSCRPTVNIDL